MSLRKVSVYASSPLLEYLSHWPFPAHAQAILLAVKTTLCMMLLLSISTGCQFFLLKVSGCAAFYSLLCLSHSCLYVSHCIGMSSFCKTGLSVIHRTHTLLLLKHMAMFIINDYSVRVSMGSIRNQTSCYKDTRSFGLPVLCQTSMIFVGMSNISCPLPLCSHSDNVGTIENRLSKEKRESPQSLHSKC